MLFKLVESTSIYETMIRFKGILQHLELFILNSFLFRITHRALSKKKKKRFYSTVAYLGTSSIIDHSICYLTLFHKIKT